MKKRKVKRKLKYKNIFKLLLIILAISLIALCLVLFLKEKAEINKEKALKEEIHKTRESTVNYLEELHKENEHVVAWIKIDGTNVDYPVLYSKDDYYLNHNYKKEKVEEGSIYIDKYNTLNDKNLILHGHNMRNGDMFHDLLKYKEKSFYKNHKTIEFYTLDGYNEYEIISVFLSKVYKKTDDVFKYYKYYGDKIKNNYDEYIENIKDLSLYDINLTASGEDLITLSTCEYSTENGRMVVVAKKVEG